ncbi:MAG: hypothetical protein RPR97_00990 [Colwellia sp.]|jgi:hypothetical protein
MGFHKFLNRNSNELFIVFSSINCPEGKFRFFKSFSERKSSVLYLNCDENSWYIEGVPSLGMNMAQTIESIRTIIDENEIERVATFGSSMGAYGAILYGALLHVSKIYAGCPELDLGIKGGFYNKYKTNSPENNIFEALSDYNGSMEIFVSEESYVDLMQAANLTRKIDQFIRVIPNDFHGVLESIESSVGINALISSVELVGSPSVIDTIDSQELLAQSNLLYEAFEMIRDMEFSLTIVDELLKVGGISKCQYLASHCYFLASVISMHSDNAEQAMEYSNMAIYARKSCMPSAKLISHHIRVALTSGAKEDIAHVVTSVRRLKLCSSARYLESNRSAKLKESLTLLRKASFEFNLPVLRMKSVI